MGELKLKDVELVELNVCIAYYQSILDYDKWSLNPSVSVIITNTVKLLERSKEINK